MGSSEPVQPDLSQVKLPEDYEYEDDLERTRVSRMLALATDLVRTQSSSQGIAGRYIGIAYGGIVAVFLFRVRRGTAHDAWMWVLCGDFPSMLIPADGSVSRPVDAIRIYITEATRWIERVESGAEHEPFLSLPPEAREAEQLALRVSFLSEHVLPWCELEP